MALLLKFAPQAGQSGRFRLPWLPHQRPARPTQRHLFSYQLPRRKLAARPTPQRACTATAAAASSLSAQADTSSSSLGEALWDHFASFAAFLTAFFPSWCLCAVALGLVQPLAFAWFGASCATTALATTMFLVGLSVPLEDFKRVLVTPGRISAGLLLQYAIAPLLALAISRAFSLPPAYAIGLCLVGICSGGSTSNVVTYLARADVTLSVVQTAAGTLAAMALTPALAKLLLGTLVPINAPGLLISTLQVVLLPALAGVAMGEAFPSAVAALRPLSSMAAVCLLACTAGANVAHTAHAVLRAGPRLLGAVVALHAGGFLLGCACSRALGLPEKTARTFAILAGMRNSSLAAMLAAAAFPRQPLAAVPCALSAVLSILMAAMLAAWWRWRLPGTQPRAGAGGAAAAAPAARPALAASRLHARLLAGARGAGLLALRVLGGLLAALGGQLAAAGVAVARRAGAGAVEEVRVHVLSSPPPMCFLPLDIPMPELSPVIDLPAIELPPLEPPPPPPLNPNAMSIIMVGAECAPWSKTGGLGDVMQALPKALAARGHRVMVVSPRYQEYEDAWETGVRLRVRVFDSNQEVGYFHAYQEGVDYCFVDHPAYHRLGREIYGGSRHEVEFRCALLCKAALEAPWALPCGGAPYGEDNLLFVANDWHASLLPVYLQAHYRDHGKLAAARSLLVLHNIAHQGRGPLEDLALLDIPPHYTDLFRLWDTYGGEHMNIMKAGATLATRIVAVSSRYAWECQTQEHGWGLDGIMREQAWKLSGVVNGIDYTEWHPASDCHLQRDGYATYDVASLEQGKARCKAALQKELGLPVDPSVPLLGFIGRLDFQKGVDLIRDNYDYLMGQGCQLVLLGSGREDLEEALRDMERRNPDKCRGWVGFSVKLAHRITAGCDMLLMPSRFEPCGLNQLYAMAYGTVPVVHAVGGLADTVQPFDPYSNSGTGWRFEHADAGAFRKALGDALYTYREYRESFRGVQLRGMAQDLSWDNAAQQYEDVLLAAKNQW